MRQSLTIGNFDGCHRGHLALLESVVQASKTTASTPGVITFDPTPEQYFTRITNTPRLFNARQKVRALHEAGIKEVHRLAFDDSLARLTHEEFFDKILVDKYQLCSLVIGHDFCFGKDRKGDGPFLKEACDKKDIGFSQQPAMSHSGLPISSTRIRKSVLAGDLELANALLGRPYLLEGMVKAGEKIGRTIGAPTANIYPEGQIVPRNGVYAAYAWTKSTGSPSILNPDLNSLAPSVVNIGVRPTVSDEGKTKIEAHLINTHFSDDFLYDSEMGLFVVKRLREERAFDRVENLQQQIKEDIQQALKIL